MAEEVVVDMTPETDFDEVSVEEETPPVQEEELPDGEEKEEEQPPEKDAAQDDEPPAPQKDDEELERIRRDNANLGYNLREAKRQKEFLEDQLRQEREKNTKRTLQDEYDVELSKISHLKDIDPDAYNREWQRITENKYRRERDQEAEATRARASANEAMERRQRVEVKLNADFPEILNQSSDLFVESRKTLESRYTPDQITYIFNNMPQTFYDIVSETNSRLKLKKIQSESADKSREKRVNGQGALESQKKQTGTGVKLTKDQLQFCKENGFKPEDYAKFVGKGRR